MDEDFAVDGEREANPEWFLQSDHVLVQVHLERRAVRHRENPDRPELLAATRRDRGSATDIDETRVRPPKRGGGGAAAEQWRR